MLFWSALITVIVYFVRRGNLTTVTLLPYQRGVLFQLGRPVRDVGPGKHRVWSGSELIVHGDIRPISVNFENLVVMMQDGQAALYGISGSAQVQDIRKAIYSARDYSHVPSAVLLLCARRQLNQSSAGTLKIGRDAVADLIAQEAKTRLAAAGFELISCHLTQLAVGTLQPSRPQATPHLNSSSG